MPTIFAETSPHSAARSELPFVAILILFVAGFSSAIGAQAPARAAYLPVPLSAVRIESGPMRTAEAKMHEYLLSVDPDRLLLNFRRTAGIAADAQPLAGWESPECELRGHFTGHYLSACALMYAATGDPLLKARAEKIVSGLAACQAKLGDGYLSAFPESFIDRVARGERVWAPWYTLHKILAGLIEVHRRMESDEALRVAAAFGRWTAKRLSALGDAEVEKMLDVEFGGMQEALADLFGETKEPLFLDLAKRFTHRRVIDPLAAGRDSLLGFHANTQIPKILGAARLYELTGDELELRIARNFSANVNDGRTYATGGTSNYEYWRSAPGEMADQLSAETHENCVTYNLLRLERRLFAADGDMRRLDRIERALWNGIMGTSHKDDAGAIMYYVPMQGGLVRHYGDSAESFACCNGSGLESFSKLAESAYWEAGDELLTALFIPSSVDWRSHGVRVRQTTAFPDEEATEFTVETAAPRRFTLSVRRPGWAIRPVKARLNGLAIAVDARPGEPIRIDREWRPGDRVRFEFPMDLTLVGLPGDPRKAAVLDGPIVLAADLGDQGLDAESRSGRSGESYRIAAEGAALKTPILLVDSRRTPAGITPVAASPMTFTAETDRGPVLLRPFFRTVERRYAIYLETACADEVAAVRGDPREGIADLRDVGAADVLDSVKIGDSRSERRHNFQSYRFERGKCESDGRPFVTSPDWLRFDLDVAREGGTIRVVLPDDAVAEAVVPTLDGRPAVARAAGKELVVTVPPLDPGAPDRAALKLRSRRPESGKASVGRIIGVYSTRAAGGGSVGTAAGPPAPAKVDPGIAVPDGTAIRPVPFTAVAIDDGFWKPRLETSRKTTIPYCFERCAEGGRMRNFENAAKKLRGEKHGDFQGDAPFDDSDIYKIIEGASYVLALAPDPALDAYLDELIQKIAAAQEPDGYLYTARTLECERLRGWFGPKRWMNEEGSHELYNAGHLFEAAFAHYTATKKKSLLTVATRVADCIFAAFGPDKLRIPPGHEVIEMGLVKLHRLTGEKRYLDLADFFLTVRGDHRGRHSFGDYSQDAIPVREAKEAVGHAVRAAYLYSGMCDVAALTGDRALRGAIDRIWENVVGKKLYITGGIGATGGGEAFGADYELPNASAYCETCAQVANVYWNHRMFLMTGDSRYIDVLERTLYNGVLSGIALDGKRFFYPNPLASFARHERSPWFGCSCCPSNVSRFIPSVAQYAYAVGPDGLFVNLFIGGRAAAKVGANEVRFEVKTDYPWSGAVGIRMTETGDGRFPVRVRIPGWAAGRPVPSDLYAYLDPSASAITATVNGGAVPQTMKDGYLVIDREWRAGDTLHLDLPMPIRRVSAHEAVVDDRGRVALERGPIVFCAEGPDFPDARVLHLFLSDKAPLEASFDKDLLGGAVVISGEASGVRRDADNPGTLKNTGTVPFRAIPYALWAHRGGREMAVWIARTPEAATPIPAATVAYRAKKTASHNQGLADALGDQLLVRSSSDKSMPFFHWWPRFGSTEWVEYDFADEETCSSAEVYWMVDVPNGGCDLPAEWRILYRDGDRWLPVESPSDYGLKKDTTNRVTFKPVTTKGLRVEVKLKEGLSAGIQEWTVGK